MPGTDPMADVINLNKFRKKKAREEAAARAVENRVRFGRTPAQKERDAALEIEARRRIDRLRREPEGGEDEPTPPTNAA